MKIGVSIQSEGLRSDLSLDKRKRYLANFNELSDYLDFIKARGVSSIEIRIYEQQANFAHFQESIDLIWSKGFALTIHGDLTGALSGNEFDDLYPSLTPLLQKVKDFQSEIIIPIHAYQSLDLSSHILKSHTIDLFNKWISIIKDENLPIYFALENNRMKELNDPCNHLNGVTEIIDKINSPHLGICWDMGHYYSNIVHDLEKDVDYDNDIKNEFFNKVIHTHIHGLNEKNTTHFPLTNEESLPLEKYVALLKDMGYEGVYNLELSFERWDTGHEIHYEVARSIERLQQAIQDS